MYRISTKIGLALGLLMLGTVSMAQFDFGGGGGPATPPWESFKLNKKTKIKLNFKNSSVDMVLAFLSKNSGITIVKDPTLTGTISVSSATAVPLKEAFEIVNSVLSMKGFDIKKDGAHLIVKSRNVGRGGRGGDTGGSPDMSSMFNPSMMGDMMNQNKTEIKVYPIQFANAAQVARVVNEVFMMQAQQQNPFSMFQSFMPGMPGGMNFQRGGRGGGGGMGRFGGFGGGGSTAGGAVRASSDDFSNSVIVNASSKDHEQVGQLIKQIDKQTESPTTAKVYPLEYASASDVAPIVQNVLVSNAPTGRGGQGNQGVPMDQRFMTAMRFGSSQSAFGTVTADTRTNALIITATDNNHKIVGSLIKELDKEVVYENTTFVFTLSNARADQVSTLLNQAFGSRSGMTNTGQSRTGNTRTNTSTNQRRNTGSGGGTRIGAENTEPDLNQLEIALQDPSKDEGELLTQIFGQGFGGMAGGGGQRRTTGSSGSQNFGRDAEGKIVNVRDLSGQITVIPDTNTNSLIVVTLPENAALVKQILDQLDKIPEQVMIETIIVEASLSSSDKMGIEWKFTEPNLAGDRGNTGTGSTDFGLKSAANSLQGFKYTMSGGKLESFLNMIKTDTKFQVLSTPRIFTANNSQAEINISQSIPYVLSQREDTNGNITYNYAFEDVGIVLTVTPRITADGFVTMDITQTANDLQGYTDFNAPIVNQRQATTTVSVKDTETIILGGIIRNTVNSTTKKIPLLGDIPLLGNLFKSTSREKAKTELMVFLTPRVVRNAEDARKLVDEQKNLLSDPSKKSLNGVLPPVKKDDNQGVKSDGKGQGDGTNLGGSK